MPDLVCYRIADLIDGNPVQDFDEVLAENDGRSVRAFGPIEETGFQAKAYVIDSFPHPPRWASFVEEGFGTEIGIGNIVSSSTLLVVQIGRPRRFFAFTFGPGARHLLRSDAFERSYGMKTALNLINNDSLRSVDTTRVQDNVLRTRQQTALGSGVDGFDIDRLRDMLREVVGKPADVDQWGPRVVGGDAFKIPATITFAELGRLCRRIDTAARRTDYRTEYPWVDHLQAIRDPVELDQVWTEVIDAVRSGSGTDRLNLTPPEIIDWEVISGFRFHTDRRRSTGDDLHRLDCDLEHYLASLGERARQIDLDYLRSHHLMAVDGQGDEVRRWPMHRCLTGSVTIGRLTYVVDDGDVYLVSRDFLRNLDAELDSIPLDESLGLPTWRAGLDEPAFNALAAASNANLLLLDSVDLRVADQRTPIEVCDLLTADGLFIHVKRGLQSRTLSHLFNQGLVSAQTLVIIEDARQQAATLVRDLDAGAHSAFTDPERYLPRNGCGVVFAVVAKWRGRPLSKSLPFFSKMTLRHVKQELQLMGFPLSFSRIEQVV